MRMTVEMTVRSAHPGSTTSFAAATVERGVAMANSAGSAASTNSRPKFHGTL
jgi:hypothetical protein